jgi:hypothetical protein
MTSGMPLETCWAFNKRWNNKFYYRVASCWLFLLIHTMMHGSMNVKYNWPLYCQRKNFSYLFDRRFDGPRAGLYTFGGRGVSCPSSSSLRPISLCPGCTSVLGLLCRCLALAGNETTIPWLSSLWCSYYTKWAIPSSVLVYCTFPNIKWEFFHNVPYDCAQRHVLCRYLAEKWKGNLTFGYIWYSVFETVQGRLPFDDIFGANYKTC